MRAVVQRVRSVSVVVENELVSSSGGGLFVLLGIKKGDNKKDADFLLEKISKLRILADENKKMNLSVLDSGSEIMVVSQFTLYADTKDGNRPSFVEAEDPKKAKILYEYFIEKLKEKEIKVATGEFGAYMDIKCDLDGPSTIVLES